MLPAKSRFRSVAAGLTIAVLPALAGCGDDGSGVDVGDLVITTASTGLDIAPEGYVVVVEDLGSRAIGPSGTVTFEGVPDGSYTVELTGVPANCTLAGTNPRTVTTGGDPLAGRFEVSCAANLGTVEVSVASSGEDIPQAYSVVLGGSMNQTVSANGLTVIDDVPAGDISAELILPANCTLQAENPRTLSVPFSDAVTTRYDVVCGPNEGALQVTTSTGGGNLDPDGYTVVVDGSLSETIGLDDMVTFDPVPAGAVVVELTGLAENCVVTGENPRTVDVAFDETASTTFAVDCDPNGNLEVITVTTGMNLPAGFTVTVAGEPDQAVGSNDTAVFPDLPAGDYEVELTDLPDHCEVVSGQNPRSVTVSNGSGSTTFEVTCWAWLVFDSDRTGNFEVFTMRHDGSQQTRLTTDPASDGQAVVSPDGTKIAFTSRRSGTEHIWVMNRNGTGLQQLTTGSVVDRAKEPYWSPDGQRIVFTARIAPDQWDIWVMDADGADGSKQNLTNDAANDGRPEWSPDGTKLVFDSERGGPQDIYLMNVDGSGVAALGAGGGGNATWSPDGSRIAYTKNTGGQLDVFVIDVDGSNPTNLTNVPGAEDGEAAWSPDGTTIAFMSARPGGTNSEREIYLMNPDGTNVRRLTNNTARDMWPSWAPAP